MAMRCLIAIVLGVAVACAAAPAPEPSSPPTTGASHDPALALPNPDAGVQPNADPSAEAAEPSAAQEQEATACPSGMVLVEGDYCTKVEHNCKESWWADWNKKKVCEVFEPVAKCVGTRVKKRYCIDKYSWPNQKGERPEVMNNFYQAQVKCAAAGKRMCTESEWNLACEGPEMKPFPHGYIRDSTKCNGDHKWDHPNMPKVARRDAKELARLWRGVRSGHQPECISDYGVADLPGNTDEVVASEAVPGRGFGGKFNAVNTGGPWYGGVRNQCRPKIYTHDDGFYYYFLSFRCCAEPDGQANEPLTPKQKHDRWKWDRVERLANFTVEQMKEKLELKKEGKCSCGERDNRCKTMCGTLLGPDAKDIDLKELRKQREQEKADAAAKKKPK
jgi:formylglycine-generating enzyme